MKSSEQISQCKLRGKLFTRLYEDNVSGKISDERFAMMSKGYEDEKSKLKQAVDEFTKFIETNDYARIH